ncbi:MAG: ATP synthase F1 subunit delta [Chloroflexota bacterium]|nr:ATP synthase F1 subunit delta [Chloroflexota bacterium]
MARVASAKRHAQAVFQLAIENNEVEKWRSELKAMAVTLTEPELAMVLENPKIHLSEKMVVIKKCLPDLSELALNLAYLLVSKQRLGILKQIIAEYERKADAHLGLEHATVVTAVPIDEGDKAKLAKHLSEIAGKQIVLSAEVDPSIIGGFVARIGDKVLDGSTKAKLEALKKSLVQAI